LELLFEFTQQIGSGKLIGMAHFPDNFARVFFINDQNKIVMQKTETPMGNWQGRSFTDPAIAFDRTTVQECQLYYIPREFLFGIALIKSKPTLLYYDVATEKFIDVIEVIGKISNFLATPLKQAIELSWVNPSQTIFDKVMIRRKLNEYPIDINDGEKVYWGNDTKYKDLNLIQKTRYYYRAFQFDVSGDYADDEEGQEVNEIPLLLLMALYIVHSTNVQIENIVIPD
jgi:hypothetical protein